VLTERSTTRCRLEPSDVAYLSERHRSHVALVPTGQRHHFQLTPRGCVGVLVTPTCRLVIRPKIPLKNLYYLLDPLTPAPLQTDAATATPGTDLFDFLAARLAEHLRRRVAVGLQRGYVEQLEQGPFLHGKLDVAAQLRNGPTRKEQLHCRFEDFTADLPCNQAPKATAEHLLGSALLSDAVRTELRQALQGFEAIHAIPLTADTFARLSRGPLPADYRSLLDLCQLLMEGSTTNQEAGPTPAPAFLLDMDRIFERYVTRGMVEAFRDCPELSTTIQPLHPLSPPQPGQPDVSLRPDITIDRGGCPVLILDAKWKRLGQTVVTTDLYQVITYAAALGVDHAVLVYPGRQDGLWTYPLMHSRARIDVRTLCVTASPRVCLKSLEGLGRKLRQSLTSG
jgi:5-methylcytosine-specific restriction enzyme subunit McrC